MEICKKISQSIIYIIDTFTDDVENTYIRFPIQTHRLNAYFVRIIKKIAEAENT